MGFLQGLITRCFFSDYFWDSFKNFSRDSFSPGVPQGFLVGFYLRFPSLQWFVHDFFLRLYLFEILSQDSFIDSTRNEVWDSFRISFWNFSSNFSRDAFKNFSRNPFTNYQLKILILMLGFFQEFPRESCRNSFIDPRLIFFRNSIRDFFRNGSWDFFRFFFQGFIQRFFEGFLKNVSKDSFLDFYEGFLSGYFQGFPLKSDSS